MQKAADRKQNSAPAVFSNADIADRLASLAQLLSTQKENPYKVRAYHRAAERIRSVPESLDEMVRRKEDLTQFAGIGAAIASSIQEIVTTGTLSKLERLRGEVSPAIAELIAHHPLDPKRVMRMYKKLNISSLSQLRQRLDSGEIGKLFGSRVEQHIRQGLTQTHAMLLYRAEDLSGLIKGFLLNFCGVRRVEIAADLRRRVEVIEELVFVIETGDFPKVIERMQRYGGRTTLVNAGEDWASFALSSGIWMRLQVASDENWGFYLVACTGATAHLKRLTASTAPLRDLKRGGFRTEKALYRRFNLQYVEPELREGRDEVERAAAATLPRLVTGSDLRGELHAHSLSSDGVDSIEDMAAAAGARGYEYIGITDHSQGLKIAGGVSVDDLWQQLRYIDKLNRKLRGFRILKSSEVDIHADGSLDYPDALLKELDYTVCSIHSRFSLGKSEQTERLMRAMDNRYFNILGHATGRLLLKRPGYEIDVARVIDHARQNGCFFEINSSPDRLDLSAENAHRAAGSGVLVAVSTDSHSTGELGLARYGIDQARRAGLEKSDILNSLSWNKLQPLFQR
ncbi:MAG TPA: PHP domain-containing protein [Candidatus Acidoferrales bacterium]|jgi:DNA polymerase (family 10)|nr:PHP domain-containing protein [Candidatus Acidoferrales bacterium]